MMSVSSKEVALAAQLGPLSGMDWGSRLELWSVLLLLQRSGGATRSFWTIYFRALQCF